MQPKISPSLEARLQPHLQKMRDGTGADDDVLPAVFATLIERQQELEAIGTGTSAKLAIAGKLIAEIADRQSAIDARLKSIERDVVKRANVALAIQVLGFIVLVGAIAFLIFRR